jgi:hypothetical protein
MKKRLLKLPSRGNETACIAMKNRVVLTTIVVAGLLNLSSIVIINTIRLYLFERTFPEGAGLRPATPFFWGHTCRYNLLRPCT